MMNTNARNKLRSMGGIMASSPELMRAAQGYQAGGPVMSAPPMIPRVDSLTMPGTGAPVVGLGRVPPMQPGRPVADGLPALSQGSPAQRFAAGVDINPYAPSPSSYLMDEVEDRDVTVDDLVESSVSGGSSNRLLNRFPSTEEPSTEEPAPVSVGSKRRTGSVTPPREVPPADPDDLNEKAKNLENQAENVVGRGSFNIANRLNKEAAELRKQADDLAADQASKERLEYFKQGGPGGLENLAAPIRTAVQDPEKAEKIRESLQKTIDEQTPLETGDGNGGDGGGGGGGDGDGGGGEPTKKDLRSRYKEKMELFKEIYGEDDEARAQDRMLSLAMMGLAIASGQSPDALTNIAQGAAVGLQGMSEQERARREQERGLQTLALESAMGDMSAEQQAAARAAEAEYDRNTRLAVEAVKSQGGNETYTPERLRQLVTSNITSNPDDYPALLTEDGSLDPRRLNRFVQDVVKGVGAASTLKTTDFDASEQATIDAAKKSLKQNPNNRKPIADRLVEVGIDPGVLEDG